MKIKFSTDVNSQLLDTFKAFDQNLLKKLNPPLASMRIERFDGMNKGDQFIFYINTLGMEVRWEGLILDQKIEHDQCYFIDIGKDIPFPLSAWTHKHIFLRNGEGTTLVDEVEFSCKYKFIEYLMLPVWFVYFNFRKFMYRKIFNV